MDFSLAANMSKFPPRCLEATQWKYIFGKKMTLKNGNMREKILCNCRWIPVKDTVLLPYDFLLVSPFFFRKDSRRHHSNLGILYFDP